MSYRAYTIYGGRDVYQRSQWVDTAEQAQQDGDKNAQRGEDIGVVADQPMTGRNESFRQTIVNELGKYWNQ